MNSDTIFNKKWSTAPEIKEKKELFEYLLKKRNLHHPDDINRYFVPAMEALHDPFCMQGMEKAVKRIFQALDRQERIMVFGDFDSDGITSTVILVHGLTQLGAQVSYRIPDRNRDSHGLKTYLIDEIADKKVKLIITCDCGVNDFKEVAYAKEKGVEIIITDHHDADPHRFPESAFAVINPKLSNCSYPEKELSGSGVAFKLIWALAEKYFADPLERYSFVERYLDICTIGLIADCVPLTGENRILAQKGLEHLKKTLWPGLRELLDQAKIDLNSLDEETIGFAIAPRLNAASRLGDVKIAAQLFLGSESQHRQRIEQLELWNGFRQELTEQAVEESMKQIRPTAPFQFFFHEEWMPGVLGLVSGRQAENLGQPVVAATLREDGKLAASCRAPEGYSIIQALHSCPEYFEAFGGHDGAAGFMSNHQHQGAICQALDEYFSRCQNKTPILEIEAYLDGAVLDFEITEFLNQLRPFGQGNPNPIFGLRNLTVDRFSSMGKNANHARLNLKKSGKKHEFVAFFCGDLVTKLNIGQKVDALFTVSENEWNGSRRLQLRLVDLKIL